VGRRRSGAGTGDRLGAAQRGLASMAHDLADGVEEQVAPPLGSGAVEFLGSADALRAESRLESVVEDHVEAQPGGVDGKFLTGNAAPARSLISPSWACTLAPAFCRWPADPVEAAAAFAVGAVGEDAEVAPPVAVAQQLAPARADADGEIAARRDRVFSRCRRWAGN